MWGVAWVPRGASWPRVGPRCRRCGGGPGWGAGVAMESLVCGALRGRGHRAEEGPEAPGEVRGVSGGRPGRLAESPPPPPQA